jgi:hypothetical protein
MRPKCARRVCTVVGCSVMLNSSQISLAKIAGSEWHVDASDTRKIRVGTGIDGVLRA